MPAIVWRLYRLAAEQGLTLARFSLGFMCYNGRDMLSDEIRMLQAGVCVIPARQQRGVATVNTESGCLKVVDTARGRNSAKSPYSTRQYRTHEKYSRKHFR
jgi:TPR repeat protein